MDAERFLLRTPRLRLRAAALSDSAFFLQLLNDPSWLANIGDRGVRSSADAEAYITKSILTAYRTQGYGLYVIELNSSSEAIGICGLVKRDYLPAPDLGFALLPEHIGRGYAHEAACAVLDHSRGLLAIRRLYAIVKPGNARSARLLERLGFHQTGAHQTPEGEVLALYTADLEQP